MGVSVSVPHCLSHNIAMETGCSCKAGLWLAVGAWSLVTNIVAEACRLVGASLRKVGGKTQVEGWAMVYVLASPLALCVLQENTHTAHMHVPMLDCASP